MEPGREREDMAMKTPGLSRGLNTPLELHREYKLGCTAEMWKNTVEPLYSMYTVKFNKTMYQTIFVNAC